MSALLRAILVSKFRFFAIEKLGLKQHIIAIIKHKAGGKICDFI
jgi:hypothetical protein